MAKLSGLWLLIVLFCLQVQAGFHSPTGSDVKPLSVDQNINALSVLWWNTACVSHEKPLEKQSHVSNLAELALPENQVDLILFGEYCPNGLPKEAIERLKQRYPYSYFVPYTQKNSETAYIGFGIFSRTPIQLSPAEHLDWLPVNTAERKQAVIDWGKNPGAFLFPRSYNRISVEKSGRRYEIVPVHLAHPWQTFLRRHKDNPIVGKAAIAKELIFGEDNPLVWQLEHFIAKLKRDFAPIDQQRLLVVGDFNFPLQVPASIGPTALAYRKLKSVGLRDAMRTSDITHRNTHLKIDHAFKTENVETMRSDVLPISGSDHFPILIEIQ